MTPLLIWECHLNEIINGVNVIIEYHDCSTTTQHHHIVITCLEVGQLIKMFPSSSIDSHDVCAWKVGNISSEPLLGLYYSCSFLSRVVFRGKDDDDDVKHREPSTSCTRYVSNNCCRWNLIHLCTTEIWAGSFDALELS